MAWAGGILFLLLVSLGVVAVNTDRPLEVVGRWIERTAAFVARKPGRTSTFSVARLLAERDRVKSALGERWGQALVASARATGCSTTWRWSPPCRPSTPGPG